MDNLGSQQERGRPPGHPLFMSNGHYVSEAIPKRLGIRKGMDALGHQVTIEETAWPPRPSAASSSYSRRRGSNGKSDRSQFGNLAARGAWFGELSTFIGCSTDNMSPDGEAKSLWCGGSFIS
jgi:hypothetical protein